MTGSCRFDSAAFEEYVQGLIEKTGVPGIGVGISKGLDLIYWRGSGLADVEKGRQVTPDTVFGLASVTKSFTALAVCRLAEEGRLGVGVPIKRYLPEFDLPQEGVAQPMTVHNFLTHTSGIPPLPSLGYANAVSIPLDEQGNLGQRPEPQPGTPAIMDNKDLMEFISSHDCELLGEPGELVSYSNDCFSMLGEVVERVSGRRFEEYLRENVWGPTGMDHTFIDARQVKDFDVQGLYFKDKEGRTQKAPWRHRDVFVSSGSIKSSVADLLKYVQMYMDGGRGVASPATIGRMTVPYYGIGPGGYYAYGLTVRPEYIPGRTLVSHGGNIAGVASYIGFVPEEKLGVVVLSNLSGFPAARVFFAAVNTVLGLPAEHQIKRATPVELPREHLLRFTGTYVSGEGASVVISAGESGLTANVAGTDRVAYPVSYDAVAVEVLDEQNVIGFLFDARGKARAIRQGLRIVPRAHD